MIKQELLRGQYVQVNMHKLNKTINSKAVFNQKDIKTATILCQLSLDAPIDLTGCSVSAEILKPDETTVIQKAQIIDATTGMVAIGLTEQCLSAIGTVQCELVVQTENQVLYSPKISYVVVDNLFDTEDIESTDEFPILNVLIADVLKVQKELEVLETTMTANESTRELQESQRNENEEQRKADVQEFRNTFESIKNTHAENVREIQEKVKEVNNKIEEIDSELDSAVDTINNNIQTINNTLNQKIGEVDRKIEEINNTIQNVNSTLDEKLASVDKSLKDKLASIDKSLSEN